MCDADVDMYVCSFFFLPSCLVVHCAFSDGHNKNTTEGFKRCVCCGASGRVMHCLPENVLTSDPHASRKVMVLEEFPVTFVNSLICRSNPSLVSH